MYTNGTIMKYNYGQRYAIVLITIYILMCMFVRLPSIFFNVIQSKLICRRIIMSAVFSYLFINVFLWLECFYFI